MSDHDEFRVASPLEHKLHPFAAVEDKFFYVTSSLPSSELLSLFDLVEGSFDLRGGHETPSSLDGGFKAHVLCLVPYCSLMPLVAHIITCC